VGEALAEVVVEHTAKGLQSCQKKEDQLLQAADPGKTVSAAARHRQEADTARAHPSREVRSTVASASQAAAEQVMPSVARQEVDTSCGAASVLVAAAAPAEA